jgi:hypothetical protein
MRPADPRKRPLGGALLLKALPAGRLAREAARALRPLSASAARALRLLRGPDAGRDAARGALLLKALPASRLPCTARARTRTKPCLDHPPAAPSQQLRLRQAPDVSDVSRDMSPPMQATLRATGFELALHITGYELPHFDTGWDANALQCYIELHIEHHGHFHASHQPIIYTVELERFARQLRALDRHRTRQATFQHGAEEISLTVRLNSGTGTLDGFLADGAGGRLSFENIDIDQAFVHEACAQVEQIAEAYPVRGALRID